MLNAKPKLEKSSAYGEFQQHPENRDINENHIRRLCKSMQKHGFLEAYPLHVTNGKGKKLIKDGGHRFEAAKRLKIPFYFVLCEPRDLSIPEINNNQKAWALRDYVASYVRQGMAEYIELKEFHENYHLPLQLCARLLFGEQAQSGNADKAVKAGTFRVKNRKYAEMVVGIICALRTVSPLILNTQFQNAISKCCLVTGFDSIRFCRNAHRMAGVLQPQATIDDYLRLCEIVYNDRIRANNRFPLAFEAKLASDIRNPTKSNK